MKKRVVIAFFATSLTAGVSFAADWPLMGPQLYPSGPLTAVEWTGLYFGVNAGYGWAQSSSTVVIGGGLPGGTTTPLGAGPNELSGTSLIGFGKLRGAIAGGQMGFNWQAGMVVFGAEVDAQWSGQQDSALGVKIRSLTTGRAAVEYLARMDGGRRCRCRVIKQLVGKTRVSSHRGQRCHFKCSDTRFSWRGDCGRDRRISR